SALSVSFHKVLFRAEALDHIAHPAVQLLVYLAFFYGYGVDFGFSQQHLVDNERFQQLTPFRGALPFGLVALKKLLQLGTEDVIIIDAGDDFVYADSLLPLAEANQGHQAEGQDEETAYQEGFDVHIL